MALQREVVSPSPVLVRDMVYQRVVNSVPSGFRWFHPDSFEPTEALGQLLSGLVDVVAPLVHATEEFKYSTSLRGATGEMLDLLGQSYGIVRTLNELDDDYATRIQQELLIERVTGPAIEAGVMQLVPYAKAYEPWKDLPVPSENLEPSGEFALPSMEYHNAAVFDMFLYPTRGDVPGIENFLQFMKAYGVRHWYTVVHPVGYVDTNDDPLIPNSVINALPNGAPDPTTPHKNNIVVGSTLDLVTDDMAGPAVGWMPSWTEGEPSEDFSPSGFEEIYFVLDLTDDYMGDSQRRLWAGDLIPAARFDRQSPNYADAAAAGFLFDEIPYDDLSRNVVLRNDIVASESSGSTVINVYYEPFTCDTVYTELQAKCVVYQTISLGDPETLGGGSTLGGELVSS